MLLRATKVRLLLFAVIAVVGVAYVGGTYAGLDRLFGPRGYQVTVRFPDSGGIFDNAEVTYRGVTVGRVSHLSLADDGVDVVLDIEDDAPRIPASTSAVVANRSAVGEQYVDLVPASADGPFLEDGSVVPRSRTSLPSSPETLLSNLDNLVTSVPQDSLRTTVAELGKAFRDTGPALRLLLDNAGALTDTATEHLTQTTSLLADARVVLDTQADQAPQIRDYASNLRLLAAQLKKSDPDLRRLVTTTPQVAVQVNTFLRDSGTDLSLLVANLLTTTQITATRTDALEHLLVAFPVVTATAPGANPDGTGHLGLVLTFNDPFSCTRGYEGTRQRPANDTRDVPPNQAAYCAEPPGSPIGVRGSQNAPFNGRPVEVPPPAPEPAAPGGRDPTGLPVLPGVLSDPGVALASLPALLGLPG
ncbi:MCE family protein [Actinophytocola xanthii]|uniref:ABC transporter substrate-binding protein n=1 Tax=Actinophytocola xanthii TaxID=1912961 RepID=A0A1Q8CX69_9PSEU|nr:MlaD family protein [Actinophytocola xanthii]OLF18945.1 ABC transporter substrate-binding protein [Actinophytocola xanthii]